MSARTGGPTRADIYGGHSRPGHACTVLADVPTPLPLSAVPRFQAIALCCQVLQRAFHALQQSVGQSQGI
jgi:hypothetical protein